MEYNIISILFGLLLYFGGVGEERILVVNLGVIFSVLFLVFIIFKKKRIEAPQGMWFYILFLLLFLLKSEGINSFYFLLFLSSGLFWVTFYNLKKELSGSLKFLIVIIGFVFGIKFLISKFSGNIEINPWSLYQEHSGYGYHNHLGDLWSIVLVVLVYFLTKAKNWWAWGFLGIGTLFLAISYSRASYVALAVGLLSLFGKKEILIKYRKLLLVLIATALTLFLYAGIKKPVLESRQYFLQAILGFIHNPWGVGIGNFVQISQNPENHIWGFGGHSSVVFNLLLEIIVGMGVWGFSFLAWFIRILIPLLKLHIKGNFLYRALFLTIAANFFFDATYFIPTMLWLWFATLGLAQNKSN